MPTLSSGAADALAQSAAIAAIVTMLIGYLRPFVEQLPFARPTASTHDATLRLMNLVLNLAGVLALAAASAGGLAASDWLPLGIQTLAMAAGSHIIFHTVTSSAGSGATVPAVPAAPAPVQAAAPSSAAASATAASVASSVASAVDAAMQRAGQ